MPLARIEDLNGPSEEVAFRIEQAKGLSALYDEFVAFDQEENHERPPGIHASEIYPCTRKAVYSCMGTPKKHNVSKFWKQRFKVGHAIHSMMQSDFDKMGQQAQDDVNAAKSFASIIAEKMDCRMEFQSEVAISPKHQTIAAHYQLYSHCDGIFSFFSLKTNEIVLRVGLEIKSKSDPEYTKLKAVEEEHIRQGHIYMAALDLPLIWFFYTNKSNQNNTDSKAPWLMVWQPSIWAEVEERCRRILTLAQARELPPRVETVRCQFCPWAWTCAPLSVNDRSKPTPMREPRGPIR
jgi:hypothetical protein